MANQKSSETAKQTRVRRSTDERIAEINTKIANHEKAIENLKAKKESILNPKPRGTGAKKIKVKKAKEAGCSNEQIAVIFDMTIEEVEAIN